MHNFTKEDLLKNLKTNYEDKQKLRTDEAIDKIIDTYCEQTTQDINFTIETLKLIPVTKSKLNKVQSFFLFLDRCKKDLNDLKNY